MGASSSVPKSTSSAFYDDGDTKGGVPVATSSDLLKKGREKSREKSMSPNKNKTQVKSPPASREYPLSKPEQVVNIVRSEISSAVLGGKTLLIPTPDVDTPHETGSDSDTTPTQLSLVLTIPLRSSGYGTSNGDTSHGSTTRDTSGLSPRSRSHSLPHLATDNKKVNVLSNMPRVTLFAHVARPSPLPQSLCSDDVKQFQDIKLWEAHLRRVMLSAMSSSAQTESSLPAPSEVPTSSNSLPSFLITANADDGKIPKELFEYGDEMALTDPEELCRTVSLITGITKSSSPRHSSRRVTSDRSAGVPLVADSAAPPSSEGGQNSSAAPTRPKPGGLSRRGQTFVSLDASRVEATRRASIHKPDNSRIVSGLSVLISYLIEEPTERCYQRQAWDIFSVPGDKTRVTQPISREARKKTSGECVIDPKEVEEYINSLYKICQWTSECHIIAFILCVRLVKMSEGKIQFHRFNWQCLLLVSLMVTQKTWDDVSLTNVDFPLVWKMVAPQGGDLNLKDVNFMEGEFLRVLDYKVKTSMRVYTACYFEVMALSIANNEQAISGLEKSEMCHRIANRLTQGNIHVLKAPGEGERGNAGGNAEKPKYKHERRNTVDILTRTPQQQNVKRTLGGEKSKAEKA